jgi:hypothetical protein
VEHRGRVRGTQPPLMMAVCPVRHRGLATYKPDTMALGIAALLFPVGPATLLLFTGRPHPASLAFLCG